MAVPGMDDMDSSAATTTTEARAALRSWGICGLLLLATMLMYMDRQALAQQKSEILAALHLNNQDYGRLELGFGMAFAIGGVGHGVIPARVRPRWLLSAGLDRWATVGVLTGWVHPLLEPIPFPGLAGFLA